ncbi:MAG: hypothetical protein RLZZ237_3635 [Pseudomonadota bacterium]
MQTACRIDHITVTAPTLEAGAEFVQRSLGILPQAGGEHPRMGTHNLLLLLLLRLGDALFLEVIAPNPGAAAPARPRWFGLDAMARDTAPSLVTWVVRTPDIRASVAACPVTLGNIEPMSRGALDWLITIPADGAPPLNGVAPALIQWSGDVHPAMSLQDHGLSLARLELFHPEPERIARMLLSLGLDEQLSVSRSTDERAAGLVAHINTPQGLRRL